MSTIAVNPYYARDKANGSITLSCATLIAGMYLLISIGRQGHGKLRVRLLLGMVASDLVLGAIVLPPEIAYIAGSPFVTDTPVCDAMGFLLTTALFTQHLWTLAIAIATFLLLKYPLSRATRYLDQFAWACWPVIWGVSALHSGLWYRYYGFASSGTLCYYNTVTGQRPDPSLLMQFIPRAFVFISIIVLYSMLYQFLRRPDTINVSSHYTIGHDGDITMQGQRDAVEADEGAVEGQAGPGQAKRPSLLYKWKASFSRASASGPAGDSIAAAGKAERGVEMKEPWEQVSFINVGGRNGLQGILVSRPPSPDPLLRLDSDETETSKLDAPTTRGQSLSTLNSSDKGYPLLPAVPLQTVRSTDTESGAAVPEFMDDRTRERQNSQSLAAFFQEYQISTDERQDQRRGSGPQPMSATQYFNRQASLLMLYFPIAYLVVFSVSLIRLIYALVVPGSPPQVLLIVSTWFVLSVGFIDGLVYGIAELVVKRRVRRKMPDRM